MTDGVRDLEESKKGKWIGPLLLVLAIVLGFLFWPFLWVEFRVRQESGLTRLNEALKMESSTLARWYLKCGADPDVGDVHGLHPMTMVRDKETALLCFRAGADWWIEDAIAWDNVPVAEACVEYHWEGLKGISEDDNRWRGENLLSRAQSAEMVRALAPLKIDPQMALLGCESADAIEELLVQGAKADARYYRGETKLHRSSHPDVIRLLIVHGADIDARTESGQSVLHSGYVGQRGLEALIAQGADVRAVDDKGRTPLHYVGNYREARILVKHGADPLAADFTGKTPLHTLTQRYGDQDEWTLWYLLSLPGLRESAVVGEAAKENELLADLLESDEPPWGYH